MLGHEAQASLRRRNRKSKGNTPLHIPNDDVRESAETRLYLKNVREYMSELSLIFFAHVTFTAF